VKNKVLLILIAAVLAVSLVVTGCPPPGGGLSDTIVIGMSRSTTGPLAIIHQSAFGSVYPTYIQVVNDAGGVTVGSTAFDLEAKVLNDNSEETKLIANANALVDDVAAGEVHTIFGPTSTHFIDVMAPIINNGDCVLMTVEGGATFLEAPGYLPDWPYVFINLSFSDWYQLPILAPLLVGAGNDGDGDGVDTVYYFWQNDAHGLEYTATAWATFPAAGITHVGNASVLHAGGPDYNSLVAAANATGADAVMCFCYPDELMGLTSAAIGGGYDFDVWLVGPGGCFGWFGDPTPVSPPLPPGYGSNANGIMTFAVANNKTSPAMENLFNNILGGGELGFQDMWGHPLYWAALEVWQDAVEAVGSDNDGEGFSISQDDLRDEIASHNSLGTAVNTVLGPTYYTQFGSGGHMMAYQCHTGEIGQWQSGYLEVIGGNNVTASVIYPKPNWT
jgi:ABC-type branched-subunit amino acid transport system substrate-binding protein